jgi:hypothetical protein
MTEHTRQSVDDYIHAAGKKPGELLFIGQLAPWTLNIPLQRA